MQQNLVQEDQFCCICYGQTHTYITTYQYFQENGIICQTQEFFIKCDRCVALYCADCLNQLIRNIRHCAICKLEFEPSEEDESNDEYGEEDEDNEFNFNIQRSLNTVDTNVYNYGVREELIFTFRNYFNNVDYRLTYNVILNVSEQFRQYQELPITQQLREQLLQLQPRLININANNIIDLIYQFIIKYIESTMEELYDYYAVNAQQFEDYLQRYGLFEADNTEVIDFTVQNGNDTLRFYTTSTLQQNNNFILNINIVLNEEQTNPTTIYQFFEIPVQQVEQNIEDEKENDESEDDEELNHMVRCVNKTQRSVFLLLREFELDYDIELLIQENPNTDQQQLQELIQLYTNLLVFDTFFYRQIVRDIVHDEQFQQQLTQYHIDLLKQLVNPIQELCQ